MAEFAGHAPTRWRSSPSCSGTGCCSRAASRRSTATARYSRTSASALDALLTGEAARRGAERLRFPPLLPRRQLERAATCPRFRTWPAPSSRSRAARRRRRAGRARRPPRGLGRVPADDRSGADAGRLLPGVSGDRRARAAARRRRVRRRRRRLGVPPRALGDPARRQMFHQHELVRIGEPDAVLAWRDEWARARARRCCAALGLAAELDRRQRPVLRPRRADARRQPARAGAQARAARPDRRSRADRAGLVQPPPGPLRRAPTASSSPTAASRTPRASGFGHERIVLALLRTHGLDPARWPARGARASCGRDEPCQGGRNCEACPAGTRRATEPHPLHGPGAPTRETNCYTDIIIELLHACGYEPLAAFGSSGPDGLRGRPVDVLQAAARGPRGAVRHRHPRDAALPAAARADRRADRAGRTIIVELDSWYLPDTASTSYRTEHVKTSVAADAIDPTASDCATSTPPACTSSRARTTAASSGSGQARRTSCRPTPSSSASTRARGWSGEELRRAARELAAPPPGQAPAHEPVRALRRAARRASCQRCSRAGWTTTTPTRSRRCGWSAPASRSPPRTSSGCSARTRRSRRRAMARDRRRLQGAVVPARPAPGVRPRGRWSAACRPRHGLGADG